MTINHLNNKVWISIDKSMCYNYVGYKFNGHNKAIFKFLSITLHVMIIVTRLSPRVCKTLLFFPPAAKIVARCDMTTATTAREVPKPVPFLSSMELKLGIFVLSRDQNTITCVCNMVKLTEHENKRI